MEFLLTKIKENLNEQMLLLTISNPRKAEEIKKYNIRPVLVKDKLMFQSAAYTKTQVFHKNLKNTPLYRIFTGGNTVPAVSRIFLPCGKTMYSVFLFKHPANYRYI